MSTNLEARATSIEERLLKAESLLASSSGSSGNGITYSESAMRDFQLSLLAKLKEVRSALVADGESGLGGGAKLEGALAEIEKLKKENARLNYRVQHLVKALNAEEAKHLKQ